MNSVTKSLRKEEAFSLVELMIVVAIIGILAGLALPKFNLFQAKARQAEVKSNLNNIYTLQQSYFGDNDAYAAFANLNKGNCDKGRVIGFEPAPCGKLRYTYGSTGGTTFDANGTVAIRDIFPGCATSSADTWNIDQNKNLRFTSNGFNGC